MNQLGKLKRIENLRDIWKHEALNFTTWLAEEANLQLLSDEIGIDIVLEERESSVGSFNVDIYAKEAGTERNIIIENQLENTDHDHLGKLLTYASGKDAKVIIWIVKYARSEHRQAIEWLNRHTDEELAFFLVEIELWQIGDSQIAPKFNIVERPNDWARQMKSIKGNSPIKQLQLEYWEEFINTVKSSSEHRHLFSLRKSHAHHYYDINIGRSSYYIALIVNTKKQNISIYIYFPNDKEKYNLFKSHKEEIDQRLHLKTDCHEATKSSRISLTKELDITSVNNWQIAFQWYLDNIVVIMDMIKDYD